ncbi:phosphatidylglycerophosphatase A family protein [Alteromonas oceanisediminis]|uniref:phosphatidylglycerophosphatase A family protein n=1 Tax=Alteromonas oceanisediminis TaxID=2836180 RepID=UPI001BDA4889|nr:phosphatidylglycerophosphatase A [Alteromonas oceanisediminis]MBT0585821.1 phosphatidylglycerophosphatase A [Alteromonas oceanisediminis]
MQSELRKRVSLRNPYHFLALGFGSGLIPFMPGTMGSIAAIPLVILVAMGSPLSFAFITLLSFIVGIIVCQRTAVDMGVHDHGSIVWDEVAGMLVTFLFVPLNVASVIAGFALFRLFDILKPWPISFLDKHMHGGLGIMLDDIVAGAMACICLHLGLYYGAF